MFFVLEGEFKVYQRFMKRQNIFIQALNKLSCFGELELNEINPFKNKFEQTESKEEGVLSYFSQNLYNKII